jgi:ABC-type nitrate/sulfonate/bicarbonate transport system substrate-binding protein
LRLASAVAVGAALSLAAAGCGGSEDKRASVTEVPQAEGADKLAPQPLEDPAKVKIGISKIEAYADILLAEEKGEFDKENLSVDIEYLGQADALLLLSQGKLDVVGTATTGGLFNLIGQGADVRLAFPTQDVAPESRSIGFFFNTDVINPDGGELKATDFIGKKILTPSGDASVGAAYLYNYLKTLPEGDKLDVKDMVYEAQLDEAAVAAAIQSGAAAGGKVNAPNNQKLLDNDCCFLLDTIDVQSSEGGAYAFGPSLRKRADVAAAFVRALARTRTEYLFGDYRKNEEINNTIAKLLEVDPKVLAAIPGVYYDPDFGLDMDVNPQLQEYYRDRGLLLYDKDLTPDQIYDLRFLEAIGHDGS